jgi:hypothetical protein
MNNYIVISEDEFLKQFKEINEEVDSKEKTYKLDFLKKLLSESQELEPIIKEAYVYSQGNA